MNATEIGFAKLNPNAKTGIAPVLVIEFLAKLICKGSLYRWRDGELCENINKWEGDEFVCSLDILGQKRTIKIAEHALLKLCAFAPEMEQDILHLEMIAKCENCSIEWLKGYVTHNNSSYQRCFAVHTVMQGKPKIVAIKFAKGDFETALKTLKGTIFDIIFEGDYNEMVCIGGAKLKGNFEYKYLL